MSYIFWQRLRFAFSLAGDVTDKKVLDFGSGGGVTSKFLTESGAYIYACEKYFFELTKRMAGFFDNRIFLYSDINDIKNIKFDVIFTLDVLEHIENLKPILDKFQKLSHRKTKIIISGPTENIIYKLGRRLAGFRGGYHLKNIYDIERSLQNNGFIMTQLIKLYFPVVLFRISLWNLR